MNSMHNFSRALAAYLAGPPKRAQNELADKSGVNRSKICRLLQGRISCDKDDLDLILNAVPSADARHELVMAFLRDMASPGALLHVKTDKRDQWEGFDFSPLSPRGRAALQAILTGPGVKQFEKLVLSLTDLFSPRT
jgi:hypothetical protein